jgi:hypothetical protein
VHAIKKCLAIVLLGLWLLVAFAVSAQVAGLDRSVNRPAERPSAANGPTAGDAGQLLAILAGVSLVGATTLSYPTARSRWYGLTLVAALVVLQFGVETVQTQLETACFRSAFPVPDAVLWGIVMAGALRALMFAPVAVLLMGRMRRAAEVTRSAQTGTASRSRTTAGIVALSLLYVVLYFVFGYFIAWQSPDVRTFYTRSDRIVPFLAHMVSVNRSSPGLLAFQFFRGLIWCALAMLIVAMMKGRAPWEPSLATALVFGVLPTVQLLLPNPLMPESVRLPHFAEVTSSMLLFGAVAGWMLARRR